MDDFEKSVREYVGKEVAYFSQAENKFLMVASGIKFPDPEAAVKAYKYLRGEFRHYFPGLELGFMPHRDDTPCGSSFTVCKARGIPGDLSGDRNTLAERLCCYLQVYKGKKYLGYFEYHWITGDKLEDGFLYRFVDRQGNILATRASEPCLFEPLGDSVSSRPFEYLSSFCLEEIRKKAETASKQKLARQQESGGMEW